MTCEDFAQKLDNYENITEDEKLEMLLHSQTCAECKKELELMHSIINVTKTLPRLSVPDNFLDALNERIDAETGVKDRISIITHLKYNWQKYSAVAACMLLVAVIGTNGDMLVSRMNGNGNGVIVDTVTTTSSPSGQAVVEKETIKPEIEEKKEEKIVVPIADEASKYEQVHQNKAAKTPDAEVRVSNPAVTPKVEPTPVEGVKETATPKQPAENETADVKEAVQSFSLEENVRAIDNNDATVLPTEDPYEINTDGKRSRYAIASGMQYPLDENGEPITDYFEKNVQQYSIYADTLIMIAAEDYEMAMNIIWKHISGSYGSYYFVTIPSYETMVGELSDEGINFEANMSAITDTITFRVITY